MKKLNESLLQVGDIILTTTTAAVSKAIRAATRSDISHAMIYIEGHSVIDATAEGVQARNTQRLLFEDECAVYVLRPREGLSDEQFHGIRNFIRERVGTQYSTKEAVRTALGGAQEWTRKQFCSRLVAQAYASVGIELVDDPHFCSPADIKASSVLMEVENATAPISAEEAARWESLADTPQMMRTAINVVLDGARAKEKNIQTFDDLNRHLINHPEDDEYICNLLETSGYLALWKVERDQNPWQYDLGLMSAFLAAEPGVEDYCWRVLANENAGPNRFVINRGGYMELSRQFGLRTFRLLKELYEHLASLHCKRIEIAAKWLETNNLLAPAADSFLRPHTPEWFAALEVWDPRQAAMTRMAIRTGGSPDVCSVCGDAPAKDYRLEAAARPAGGVDTLRLCDDCLTLRRRAGEPFVPLPDDAAGT